jgi:cytochrome c-type biogenesis protein CcmH
VSGALLWVFFALMTLAVLALLGRPLYRAHAAVPERRELTLAVYRRQLAELEAEAGRDLVGGAALEEARREIERRLLAAAADTGAAPAPGPSWRRGTLIGLLLTLPAAAVALYLVLGAPGLPGAPWVARQPAVAADPQAAEMAPLVAQLAEKMQMAPGDPQGWRLLGRSYLRLGRHAEAAQAFQRLLALEPDDVEARLDLGEAMTLAASGQVTPEARIAFEAALRREPRSARGRYYLGLASWQAGEPQAAFDRWLALAREAPAEASWRPLLIERLRAAAARLGIDLAAELPAAEGGPSAAEVEAAATLSPEARQAMIRGMVDGLAARLEAAPDDFEGWMRLGSARAVLGEFPAAAEAYGRAAMLRPEDTAPEAGRLQALIDAGDLAAAEALWLSLAPRLDPNGETHRALDEALAVARRR